MTNLVLVMQSMEMLGQLRVPTSAFRHLSLTSRTLSWVNHKLAITCTLAVTEAMGMMEMLNQDTETPD